MERLHTDCIHPKENNKGIALMVSGCFWGKPRGSLIPITRTINKTRYVRLLRRYLFPVFHQMISCCIDDFLFQQNNFPVHKAYSVMDCLEANKIDIIEHSLYSPDLNPIEHVWVEPKKRLHQQHPRISDTPGRKEAVKKKLAEVPPLILESISSEFFEKLWRSMPKRVAAILQVRGGYTKY